MSRSVPLQLFLVSVFSGSALAAQVAVTSQTRYVRSEADIDDGTDFDSDFEADRALDMGPFLGAVSAAAAIFEGTVDVGAFQDSTISSSAFVARGSSYGSADVLGPSVVAMGRGTSYCDISFSVASPTTYSLQGVISESDNGFVCVSLFDANSQYVFGDCANSVIDRFGLLAPGNYRYEIYCNAGIYADWNNPEYAFSDYDLAFELRGDLGTRYCAAVPNSTGNPGRMTVSGSATAADGDLVLVATDLPWTSNSGYFLMGSGTDTFTPPGSAGPICIAPGILRHGPPVSNTDELPGGFRLEIGTSGPISSAIVAGSTWNFQAWHRDAAHSTSNFTDAVSVTFL